MDARIRSGLISDIVLVVVFVLSALYGRIEPILRDVAILEVLAIILVASLLAALVSSGLVLGVPRGHKMA